MRVKLILLIFFEFILLKSPAQKPYILELKPQDWGLSSTTFYINKVVDNRQDKKNAGSVLSNGKVVPAFFQHPLEDELMNFLNSTLPADTTGIPLTLSIEKFQLNETGTLRNHKATLHYAVKFYKEKGEKKYMLYEASGSPYFTIRGNFQNVHEKNIYGALKNTFTSFNEWLIRNSDIPPLVKSVQIIFETDERYSTSEKSDTISWSPEYKLNWSDFRGKERPIQYMAESNCIFVYKASPEIKERILYLHINLRACFDKQTSWVKKGQDKPELLNHEQLHFDICELHIRTLKKKIKEFAFDTMDYDQQIQKLFEEVWNDYQLEQEQYDKETDHGILKAKQDEWMEKINGKLDVD
jgi:hypothetical protein